MQRTFKQFWTQFEFENISKLDENSQQISNTGIIKFSWVDVSEKQLKSVLLSALQAPFLFDKTTNKIKTLVFLKPNDSIKQFLNCKTTSTDRIIIENNNEITLQLKDFPINLDIETTNTIAKSLSSNIKSLLTKLINLNKLGKWPRCFAFKTKILKNTPLIAENLKPDHWQFIATFTPTYGNSDHEKVKKALEEIIKFQSPLSTSNKNNIQILENENKQIVFFVKSTEDSNWDFSIEKERNRYARTFNNFCKMMLQNFAVSRQVTYTARFKNKFEDMTNKLPELKGIF